MLAEIERFIERVRLRNPQAKTWRDYRCDLHLFAELVEDRNVGEIFPRDIDQFVNDQVQKGYKPSTVNRRLAAVVSFYRFLLTEGMVTTCPVLPRRHYLREPQRLPRPLSDPDLRKYFQSIDDTRDRAMFTLMLRCGLRIGEVAALETTDLYLGESPSRMIVRGKGARERTLYLSPSTEQTLQAWLVCRPKARDKHVFLSYQQKRLSTTSISKRVDRIRRISGVMLTAHRLRHTFADHLLSVGTPITTIQKLMGHRFVETTQTYATANDRQVQADFYRASRRLDGWALLLESIHPGLATDPPAIVKQEPIEDANAKAPVQFIIPAHVDHLPEELLRQLESYRGLKVNRWREERVLPNSTLFYSQHGILWRFFVQVCGVMTVPELHLEHVLRFMKHRLDMGCCAKTVNSSLSSLRSFLAYLKEDGVVVHPSLENIQRLKTTDSLPRYITSAQVLRLKNAMEAETASSSNREKQYDTLLLRAIFYLLWQGGLRSGEVEMLHLGDFYISQANEAKRLFIRDGKWRQGRAVYLTDVALNALKEYLAVRGTDPLGDFVFVRHGNPLKKEFFSRRLQSLGQKVDVNVSPHRLRHTFATQLLNVGCQITSIQRLLGHTNLNTTMTYARAFDHTVMTDYFAAVDRLETQPEGAWFPMNESTMPS